MFQLLRREKILAETCAEVNSDIAEFTFATGEFTEVHEYNLPLFIAFLANSLKIGEEVLPLLGMVDDYPLDGSQVATCVEGLDLVGSRIDLAGAELELVGKSDRERTLQNVLKPVVDKYDYILIDCSPSLGLITVNALTAADSVIIPVQAEYFALEGISKLLNTIRIIKSRLNPDLEIEGFLLTMYDARLRLANQIYEELKGHFGDMVFSTVIPRNIRLSEAPSHGLPALLYDPESRGATSHTLLAKELITKHRRHPVKNA